MLTLSQTQQHSFVIPVDRRDAETSSSLYPTGQKPREIRKDTD